MPILLEASANLEHAQMPVSRHCLFKDRNAQVQAATVTPISMATPMIEAATTKALKSSGMQHLRIAQVVVKEDRVSDGSKEEQAPDAFATGSSKTIDEIVFGGQKGPRTNLSRTKIGIATTNGILSHNMHRDQFPIIQS